MFKRRPGSLPQHFRLRATSGTDSPKARSGTTDTSGTYELISECFLNAPYILRHHLYRQKDEENQNCQLKNMDQEEDQTLLGKSRELLYMNFPFLLTILSNCKDFHFPWFLCVCVCVWERERERERDRMSVCTLGWGFRRACGKHCVVALVPPSWRIPPRGLLLSQLCLFFWPRTTP